MILAAEVVIAYLLSQSELTDLVGQNIALKHRYGEVRSGTWDRSEPAITVKPDGGTPDNSVPLQEARLQVRIYAPSAYEALQVWGELLQVMRATNREPVAVTGGTGVLQSLIQETLPNVLWDDEINLDFVLVFLRALVPEIPA